MDCVPFPPSALASFRSGEALRRRAKPRFRSANAVLGGFEVASLGFVLRAGMAFVLSMHSFPCPNGRIA
jgi:hypothetical protein